MSFTSKIILGTNPVINITDNATYLDPSIVKGIVNIEGPEGWVRGGTNADIADYTVSTKSIDISLPLDILGNPLSGNYKVTLVTEGEVTTQTVNYSYTHLVVVPSISFDVNIPAAFAKTKETTGYGSGLQSQVRVLTVEYPQGIEPEIADLVTSSSEITITPLYTGTYTVTLANTYQLLVDGLYIEGSFSQAFERVIVNDTRLCEAASCIAKVQDKFKEAISNNPFKVSELSLKIQTMLMSYMNYTISVNCGKPDQTYINLILEEAKLCGCECSDCGPSEGPQLISTLIPGIGDSNEILYGSGVPNDVNGANGDTYIDTSTSNIYKKENDAWVFKLNVAGVAGSQFLFGSSAPSNLNGVIGDTYMNTTSNEIYKKVGGSWVLQTAIGVGTFVYYAYCDNFSTGPIVATNLSQTRLTSSKYIAIKSSATALTLGQQDATFFNGSWVQIQYMFFPVSPFTATPGSATLIGADTSSYKHYDGGYCVDVMFTLDQGISSVTLEVDLVLPMLSFKEGLLYCSNLDKMVRVVKSGVKLVFTLIDAGSPPANYFAVSNQIAGQLFF
jgi:hypothetical protein